MTKQKTITAAKAKYLISLYELDPSGRGIRSVVLAEKLGVSRPSVHSMIMKLQEMGYVSMEHYGIIFLTPLGQTAGRACMEQKENHSSASFARIFAQSAQ